MILALLGLALAVETPLVTNGSTWSYWDLGSVPGSQWNTLGYDDSSWATGDAPLGYGAAGILTQVDYGPDPTDRHITTWFRHEFTAANTASFTGLALTLRRDDGVAVYLNGVEVFRENLPGGLLASDTLATIALNGLVDQELLRVPLDPGLVQDGNNVLAIEVHQASPSSTDLALEAKLSGWDDAGTITRGPYLQSTGPTSTVVRWRTEGPTPSRVWIGDAPGSLTQTFDGASLALDHEVTVNGLSANTTKFYGVGSPALGILAGDDFDHQFTTAPTPGSPSPFRAWVLGDPGTANSNQEAVRDAFHAWAGGVPPDLVLLLGDNAYNSGTDNEYQDAMFDIYPSTLRQVAFWSCIGNHDGYTAASLTQYGPYFDLFTFPTNGENGGVASGTEAWGSFDYANVHFINLDSYGSDRSPGSPMLQWLEADLQATTQDWIVAFWHHPAYSKGSHNSDIETQLVEMREHALPLLEAYGVDLVLAGHSHSYERSWLLDQHYGSSNTLDRGLSILDEGNGDPFGDGTYRKPTAGLGANEGAVYVVAGSSGKVSGGSLDHPAKLVSLSVLGSVALDFDGDQLHAVFIDDLGMESDRFSIRKGVATITEINGDREPLEGEVVAFDAVGVLANGNPIPSFDWSFGDGSPDETNTTAVTHTWPGEGDWRMEVSAVDDAGQPFSEVAMVRVRNGPPTIDPLVAPSPCDEGELLTWTATGSDPGGDPITWSWDFGDGTVLPGQTVNYRLGDDGPHTVTVTATDDELAFSTESVQVLCNNLPPIYQGVAHPPLVVQEPVTLTALYTDPGRDDTVTVDWDLQSAFPSTGPTLDHTFATTGTYALTVTLTDDDGGVTVAEQVLTVTNGPPVLDVLSVPLGIDEGETVTMAALAHEPNGEPFVVSWDFGDGNTAVGEQVDHAWEQDGFYEVRLTLDDGTDGGRVDHWFDVQVHNQAPFFVDVDVSSGGTEGSPIALAAAVDDPGPLDVLTVRWAIGAVEVQGATATYTPMQDGAFEAWVTVTDEQGAGETRPVVFSVLNAPPRITDLPRDTTAYVNERWSWTAPVTDPGNDPIHFEVGGPTGVTVLADGTVLWTPAAEHEGTSVSVTVRALDEDGAASEVSFDLSVQPARTDDHEAWRTGGCGCSGTGGPALGLWPLALLGLARRRRLRSGGAASR